MKVVPRDGNAPPSAVRKTAALLLDERCKSAYERIRTSTGAALNRVPLLLGYVSVKWSLLPGLRRPCRFTKPEDR